MDSLADIFESGFEYRAINTHRSAVSAFHELIEELPVEKRLQVCNLIANVYNKRPSKLRYCFVWDIEILLRYLTSLPIKKLLSTKLLTLKSTILLPLTLASRCSEIRHLDIRFYTKSERNI